LGVGGRRKGNEIILLTRTALRSPFGYETGEFRLDEIRDRLFPRANQREINEVGGVGNVKTSGIHNDSIYCNVMIALYVIFLRKCVKTVKTFMDH